MIYSDSDQTVLVYCLGASLADATLVSFLSYQVVSGKLSARRRLYVYALALSAVCVATLFIAFFNNSRAVLAVSIGGVLASVVAVRSLSGTTYEMMAAFFRAKRAHSRERWRSALKTAACVPHRHVRLVA